MYLANDVIKDRLAGVREWWSFPAYSAKSLLGSMSSVKREVGSEILPIEDKTMG